MSLTRWRPDVCPDFPNGCIIDVDYKANSYRTVSMCTVHIGPPDKPHHDRVIEECQRKEYSFDIVFSQVSGVAITDINTTLSNKAKQVLSQMLGSTITDLGQVDPALLQLVWESAMMSLGIGRSEYKPSFDVNRVLEIKLPARITAAKKAAIQTACNARFGAGKVRVI